MLFMNYVLEVRHLQLVRALAEEGGPTRAAARLHLSQSAVSHQLSSLEAQLGVQLFTRVRRRLELSRAGKRVLELALSTLSEIGRVERELHHGQPRPKALRVAVQTFTAYHWLPSVVATLRREAPEVAVQIVADARRDPLAALERGSLDVAIVCAPVTDPALRCTPLFVDEWAVIVSPAHRLAANKWISVSDLKEEALVANEASRSDVERLREILAVEGVSMPQATTVPFTCALVELVSAGVAVGLVSRWAVEPWVRRREVRSRRFTRSGVNERWYAIYRRNTELPLERFVDLVRRSRTPR